MPESRLARTREAYKPEPKHEEWCSRRVLVSATDKNYFSCSCGATFVRVLKAGRREAPSDSEDSQESRLRRYLGMTPRIPEGRATFDALIPNRYRKTD